MGTSFSILEPIQITKGIQYSISQLELCPSTGRKHLQFMLRMEKKVRRKQVQSAIGDAGCHLEVVRDILACKEYCSKSQRIEGPWELGDFNIKPTTNTPPLKKIKRDGLQVCIEQNPFKVRTWTALLEWALSPRGSMTIGLMLTGEAGKGKSKIAYNIGSFLGDVYFKDSTKWWNGYQGQPTVIVDDYRRGFTEDFWLRLLDRYPLRVETKGGYVNFNSKVVFVTSNETLSQTIGSTPQILRRIKEYTIY